MKLTIDIPDETYHRLKQLVRERGTTLQQIVLKIIDDYLDTPTQAKKYPREDCASQ